MKPIFHTHFQQNSAEWFRIRVGKVTASEMTKIVTPTGKASSQCSAYMNRLLAEWALGRSLTDDSYQSDYMTLGHDNEQATVESFEFQTEFTTSTVGFVERSDGLIGCSPDRLIDGGGTLEVKSPAPQTQIGYLLDPSELEKKYFVQIQTQLWICEFDFGYIHTDSKPLPPIKPVRVNRDEDFILKISTATNTFLETMLGHREALESKYGPFERPKKAATEADPLMAEFYMNDDDFTFFKEQYGTSN